jgi:hypothetical protein
LSLVLCPLTNMFPISPDNQQPVSTVSRPSEDDISMQVDMDESAVTPHPLQSSQSTLSIPDDIFQGACHVLEFLINPSSSDAMNMTFIHYNVYAALEKDPDLSTRRADEREFGKNVERIGKQRVIDDFRDAAKKKAWGELMRHGTFPPLSFDLDRPNQGLSPEVFLKPETVRSQERFSSATEQGEPWSRRSRLVYVWLTFGRFAS